MFKSWFFSKPAVVKTETVELDGTTYKVVPLFPELKPGEVPKPNYYQHKYEISRGCRAISGSNHDLEIAWQRESGAPNMCGGMLYAWTGAYNNHGAIAIHVDDIWFSVLMRFAEVVGKAPDAYRKFFTDKPSGSPKDKIQIRFVPGDAHLPPLERSWEPFLQEVIGHIDAAVSKAPEGAGVVGVLRHDFSVTSPVFHLASTIAIMDTTKHYYEFESMLAQCGLSHVLFGGTVDDWKHLRDKLAVLTSMAQEAAFATELREVDKIIGKFIETIKGEVDRNFWRTVMDIKKATNHGSSRKPDQISGWILRLFATGTATTMPSNELNFDNLCAPVKRIDELANQQFDVNIVANFFGCNMTEIKLDGVNRQVWRPIVQTFVVADKSSIAPLS